MKITEIISEADLFFKGDKEYRCTKDCSGHGAGYAWAKRKNVTKCNSHSNSFNRGCHKLGAEKAAKPRYKMGIPSEPGGKVRITPVRKDVDQTQSTPTTPTTAQKPRVKLVSPGTDTTKPKFKIQGN